MGEERGPTLLVAMTVGGRGGGGGGGGGGRLVKGLSFPRIFFWGGGGGLGGEREGG